MVDDVNPVELEHRLTTIEVTNKAGFESVRQSVVQQGSETRLSVDSLTREVGKVNGRVKELEVWRGTYEHRIVAGAEAAAEATHEIAALSLHVGELQAALKTAKDKASGRDGLIKMLMKAGEKAVEIGVAVGALKLLTDVV